MSRLEESKNMIDDFILEYKSNHPMFTDKDIKLLKWLIKRVEELEYASQHNGKLNEFLQKRELPPNTLGRHVVDVVMDYVNELEKDIENYKKACASWETVESYSRKEAQRYKQALEEIAYADWEMSHYEYSLLVSRISHQTLKGDNS